ncbi:MAG: 50S ribosome-binding GTPase [Actinomycetia bacterium]|nr:50S ribosome-binding GTPase [Actinomycetes bacterium]
MSAEVLVVGRPNAGKSLFVLNFAAFLGLRAVRLAASADPGASAARWVPLERARREWVSPLPYSTLEPVALRVVLAVGGRLQPVQVVDCPAIDDGSSPSEAIRRAWAVTLERLLTARVVLHVLDAANPPRAVDAELAAFVGPRAAYAVLANKCDLPEAAGAVRRLRRQFAPRPVLAVSAATNRGFAEVARFLADNLPG